MRTALSVNVNKVAWLRNAREGSRPDVVATSAKIIASGAHGITVHPRPDLRHIRPQDVYDLAALTNSSNVEFNIEGNPLTEPQKNGYPGFMNMVREICPTQCTLVPDEAAQITSDHGWELRDSKQIQILKQTVEELRKVGIRASIFVDAEPDIIRFAREVQTDRIELFTGPWAIAVEKCGLESSEATNVLQKYREAADEAHQLGLGVNAGHDLDLHNLSEFIRAVVVDEVSIGHALVADALNFGLPNVVKKYLEAINMGCELRVRDQSE